MSWVWEILHAHSAREDDVTVVNLIDKAGRAMSDGFLGRTVEGLRVMCRRFEGEMERRGREKQEKLGAGNEEGYVDRRYREEI